MRFPPNGTMEVILTVALFLSVVVFLFALRAPRIDHTHFTLERSETAVMSGRPVVPVVEETLPGR